MRTKNEEEQGSFEDYLIYDKGSHRISLYAPEILKKYPEAGNYSFNSNNLQQVLDEHSQLLYTWIYANVPIGNRDYVEFLIARDKEMHRVMYECLVELLKADLYNNFTQRRFEIDPKANQVDAAIEFDRIMPELVKLKISGSGILFQGDFGIMLPKDRYERWDF